jgi:hypothetical protein
MKKFGITQRAVVISVFLALIALPCIGSLPAVHEINRNRFVDMESREPNDYPALEASIEALGLFPQRFEAAFNDRFGFRRDLITLYKLLMFKAFNISTDRSSVVVGKDGWLFLGDRYESVFARHTGARPPEAWEAESVIQAERQKQAWLQRRGIAYLYAVAPDKHSIYPEYFPKYVRDQGGEVLLDMVMARADTMGLPVLDLRRTMLQSKTRHGDLVYSKTDSHWSNLGCYDGYWAIMSALSRQTGPLKTLSLNGYETTTGRAYNLEGLLGLRKHYKMEDVHINLKLDHSSSSMHARGFDGAPVQWDDGREVHYNDQLIVSNRNALNDLRVFMLRDSFANRLSPMLNLSFSEVLYTHYNRESLNVEIVDLMLQFRPDILLFEMVERNLAGVRGTYTPWQSPLVNSREAARIWPKLAPATTEHVIANERGEVFFAPGDRVADILVRLETDGHVLLEYSTEAAPDFKPAPVHDTDDTFVEIKADSPIKSIRLTSAGTSGVVEFRKMSEQALRQLYR